MSLLSLGVIVLLVAVAADLVERAVAALTARRGGGPGAASPAAGPVPAARPVDAAIDLARLDYDLYRVAGWLPGERDYRRAFQIGESR